MTLDPSYDLSLTLNYQRQITLASQTLKSETDNENRLPVMTLKTATVVPEQMVLMLIRLSQPIGSTSVISNFSLKK